LRKIKLKSIRKSVKQFNQFILEARSTQASQQAKRLGLVGNGHGDWYDKQGSLKAKTVKGQLKMFTPRAGDSKDGEKSSQSKANTDGSTTSKTSGSETSTTAARTADYERLQQVVQNQRARQEFDAMARKEPLTIAFDKFDNDEVTNNILAAVEETAQGFPYYIFPSRDADIARLKETFGDVIIDDANAETIYDVLQSIYESGYNAINIIVRKSRAQEIAKLALEQNGELYRYIMMNIIPVDERSIREQYLAGDIFKEGELVETKKSSGVIIRRGANHVICLDENNNTFRSWITEIKLNYDIN